jgi:hypothetical protein
MITEASNKLSIAVDRTLQYYAFFRYPLLAREIWQSCNTACTVEEVRAYLQEQELLGKVFSKENYFTVLPDAAGLLERRRNGSEKAANDLKLAKRIARFLYQCPFVSFVGISGSLSKGYSDERSDYDFFIITQTDRLWLSRTLLHLFKKLTFLVGQQHKFCMNYFIDESALLLEEQNIYIATELCSLIPVCGADVYRQFMHTNAWSRNFLPNYRPQKLSDIQDRNGLVKRLMSAMFNRLKPASFNEWLMQFTDRRWRKKWARKAYPAADYDDAFKTRRNISKNHHLNYQKRILAVLRIHEAA